MAIEFYRQMLQILRQKPVVLATVTQVRGSVPREAGAKMLIAQGQTFGTIGGGAGEAKVIQQAQRVLQTGQKQFVEIDLSGTPDRLAQGVCGGWMQAWLERWAEQVAIALVEQILTQLQSGLPVALVTPFGSEATPYLDCNCSSASPAIAPLAASPTVTGFIEPLQSPPTLLIVGAGHVAVALAQVAHLAGFRIVVQDDRPEFARPERFPLETIVLPLPMAAALQTFPLPAHLYVALVTRGFHSDLEALNCLLQAPIRCRYIGMIGSEKRVRTVFQSLQQQGISPSLLQQIHAPIGLSIGALTPEEIAVSICAELIQVRRGGTGQSLSTRRRSVITQPAQPIAPGAIPDAQRHQQVVQ